VIKWDTGEEMICIKCRIDKPETEEFFWRRIDNGKLRNTCNECAKKYKKEYYQNNRERCLENKKEYYRDNKEICNEKHKNWLQNNPEYNKEYCKKWYQNNKEYSREHYKEYRNNYHKRRLLTDPIYKLVKLMRIRIRDVIKTNEKSGHAVDLIGCTGAELKLYLESKFQPGMTWENHGNKGWHIDHIIPCASFNLSKPEEQQKCFHYTNLQPLWAEENLRKGDKL
jgi:hypothetical protein